MEEDRRDADVGERLCGIAPPRSCAGGSDGNSASTCEKDTEAGQGCAPAEEHTGDGRGGGCEEEEEEEEWGEDSCAADILKSRAPDGGWGWMVALGTLILNTLSSSLSFCFGILFSGFLLENGTSSTTTACIYNLYLVVWNVSLSFSNTICQEFGLRCVGFISVLMASLSLILSGFPPTVSFLYFSFSLVGGLGSGMMMGIAFIVLPPYFNKRSGQANTFLVAGSPITQMVLGPLIRYLLAEYSLKGAAMIHGAIVLNGLIAVSFFHPVKWHLKPSSREKPRPQHDKLQPLLPDEDTSLKVFPDASALKASNSVLCKEPVPSLAKCSVMPVESDVLAGVESVSDVTEKSTAVIKPPVVMAFWRMLSRVAETFKSDVTVLRKFKCVILAFTFLLTQTTFLNFIMMLPFIALASNHSLQDAARCIALLGVTNLVTRLVVSPLSDCKMFSIRFSIMLGYMLKALGAVGASMSIELWQFMASAAIFGLGVAFSISMFVLGIVHYMGMENLRPTISIVGLVSAIGFPTLGPLVGFIRDTTDSYSTSLRVLAAMDLLSVGLWFLMPAAQARDARTELQIRTSCEASRPF